MRFSARNEPAGTVVAIEQSEAVATVELGVAGLRVVASPTVEEVQDSLLPAGADPFAVVKATAAMIVITNPEMRLRAAHMREPASTGDFIDPPTCTCQRSR